MAGKKPEKAGKPWTKGDVEHLKKEIGHNTPTPLIAHHLQRTESAIRGKVQDLGLSLKPTNKSPYGTGGKKKQSK
jgi:hypothetical protein